MKHTKLLDAALVAALLLANMPELSAELCPASPELALIAPADTSEENHADER